MSTTNTTLLDKLQQCEKISLNSLSGWKWLIRLLVFFSISSLIINVLLIQQTGLSSFLFLASCSTAVVLLLWLVSISNKIANAYIKGDMIIINYYRKQSPKVMDIRCIRSIKTRSFIGLSITRLEFKFDGVRHHAMLLGNPNINDNAESIFRFVRNKAA